MRYIHSPSQDAFFNMALEEYVFEALPRSEEWFMLWQNKNAVVVGRYQNTLEEINRDFVRENDIQVVRRLSGGGAMYQDLGNLNFTFVVDRAGAELDFATFTKPVADALGQLGVKAETSGRNDILVDGKKFSGNAQYTKRGRTMHHGTLLFDSKLDTVAGALNVKPDKIQSKGVKSVKSRVTNIAPYLPEPIGMERFKSTLLQKMFAAGTLTEYTLTPEDLAAVESLKTQKYASWDWNWGKSPACDIRCERRYPFGSVAALLTVEGGHIKAIAFQGDFFGNGDIKALAQSLAGLPFRAEAVRPALEAAEVGTYIHGMDAGTLCGLLEL